jgi:hypothetical protein
MNSPLVSEFTAFGGFQAHFAASLPRAGNLDGNLSFALSGLVLSLPAYPRLCAVGCILSPLRG